MLRFTERDERKEQQGTEIRSVREGLKRLEGTVYSRGERGGIYYSL